MRPEPSRPPMPRISPAWRSKRRRRQARRRRGGRRRSSASRPADATSTTAPRGRRVGDARGRSRARPSRAMSRSRSTRRDRRGQHVAAVAQHGDAVGELHDLVDAVRDVDDRHAFGRRVRRTIPNSRCALGRRQGRGRLVHDQDAGLRATAPWRSRPAAARRRAAPPTGRRGSSVDAERAQAARAAAALPRRSTKRPARSGSRPRKMLSATRQLRHEVELLVDDGDAGARGLAGAGEPHRLAVDRDLAVIVGIDAGQDLHQRRLAGAVLAHQGMDLARARREIDALEHRHIAERFADAAHGEQRWSSRVAHSDRRASPVPRLAGPRSRRAQSPLCAILRLPQERHWLERWRFPPPRPVPSRPTALP